MKVVRRDATDIGEHFVGHVRQHAIQDLMQPKSVRISRVDFAPFSRTYWHSHRGGQMLLIVDGMCETQVRNGGVEQLATGDAVLVGPNEQHWHGAAADHPMTHISIAVDEVDWGEPPDR